MSPFFKLSPGWEKKHQSILVVGPEGLITHQVISTYINHHKKPIRRGLITQAQDCLDLREQLATQSLFDEEEIWVIRLTQDNLLNTLSLPQSATQKNIIIIGTQKKPSKCAWIENLSLIIQSYPLKEPFASKQVMQLANQLGISISPKAAQWIVLCYQGKESLIPITVERIAHVYGSGSITDDQIKPLLHHQSAFSPFDILNALLQSKAKLKLILKSIKPSEWNAIYWMLLSHWRKIVLTQSDPKQLGKHFPWKNQQSQVNTILKNFSPEEVVAQHQQLLNMESAAKGLAPENLSMILPHWLLEHCAKL